MANARIVDRAPERTLFAKLAPFVRLPVASVKAGAIVVEVELDLFNFERWGLIMGERGATMSGESALSTYVGTGVERVCLLIGLPKVV